MHLDLYALAYIDLDTDRPEYLSPIPWSKIVFYCSHNEFDDDQTETALYLIRQVDNAILKKRLKEVNRGQGKSP